MNATQILKDCEDRMEKATDVFRNELKGLRKYVEQAKEQIAAAGKKAGAKPDRPASGGRKPPG